MGNNSYMAGYITNIFAVVKVGKAYIWDRGKSIKDGGSSTTIATSLPRI